MGLTAMKTNFDRYLKEQLKAPVCGARFERAGEAWDVARKFAAQRRDMSNPQRQNRYKNEAKERPE